ncbi:transmembrane protein 255A isoform X3 [Stegostoma tigrinum]|uniref:transmembrane protein 255A isoform X3 n=1 Tax=Stegostoma tigrinum TaxID=3053191 RepID=UPI00202B493C|nr:transmembrane protein 255A isoform X3 [Stegostoma tigrinum]
MQRPLSQQQSALTLHDSVGLFNKRKKASLLVSGALLVASLLILTVGLAATTRTLNVSVGGYYPGVILGFGSFLGLIGANLLENKRQMLVASIVFISFGVVASFCCAIVDGVFAARHIDIKPFHAGRCQYYSSDNSYPSDDYSAEFGSYPSFPSNSISLPLAEEQTRCPYSASFWKGLSHHMPFQVTCPSQSRAPCILKIKSNTCYCCDLYKCGSRETLGGYYEYNDVGSCQEVIHLYHLLWSSTILNIVGLFLGIITAAVLGSFKDMHPSIFSASTPSDDSQSISQSASSYMWPPNTPPRYSPAYFPPDEKPPPYTP